MMGISPQSDCRRSPALASGALGYGVFCVLSYLSRLWYPLFGVAALAGIVFPLAWGATTGRWSELGVQRNGLRRGLAWGAVAGLAASLLGFFTVPDRAWPADMVQQLAIGVPMWLLLISPFQELFFRGWLQSRLELALGRWVGLSLATLAFLLWHYISPIASMSTFPMTTPAGVLSTFAAGLFFGYSFQRSRHIVAPWLAHALAGLTFILIGAMDFVGAMG